jgi:hypothetical protein
MRPMNQPEAPRREHARQHREPYGFRLYNENPVGKQSDFET